MAPCAAAWLARLMTPFDARVAADFQARAARAYTWAHRGTGAVAKANLTLKVRRGSAKVAQPVALHWKEDPTAHYFPGSLAAQELFALTGDAAYRQDAVNTFVPHALRFFKIYPHY